MSDIDTTALKENFAVVAAHGPDDVALYFCSYLFLRFPKPGTCFRQRDRLVGGLVRIVATVDKVDQLVPYLADM